MPHTELSHVHLEVHSILPFFLVLPALSTPSHLHLIVQVLISLRPLVRITATRPDTTLRQATANAERRVTGRTRVRRRDRSTAGVRVRRAAEGLLPTAGLSARWFGPELCPRDRLARTSSPLRPKLALMGDRAETDDGEIGPLDTTEPMLEIDKLWWLCPGWNRAGVFGMLIAIGALVATPSSLGARRTPGATCVTRV